MIKYFIFISIVTSAFTAQSQEIKAMTYNIRLDTPSDGDNAWPNRKEFLISQLEYHNPDLLGTQEGLPHQINYIKQELPQFNMIGEGRDGGNTGEHAALFYNKNRFVLKDAGTFWLSKTPDTISRGWDAALKRVCTYGLFYDKESKKNFWVFNTHFDHVGKLARKEAAALILKRKVDLNKEDYPVLIMGDLNVTPDSEVIALLNLKMIDTRNSALKHFGQEGTFNGFKFDKIASRRIDYIFVSKGFSVLNYATITDSKDLHFPSDHFPVVVILDWD